MADATPHEVSRVREAGNNIKAPVQPGSIARGQLPRLREARAERLFLRRSDLEARRERELARGGRFKADVWISRLPHGQRVVVKEFARRGPLGRFWGRVQVRREARALGEVESLGIAPRLVARLDPLTLVLEHLEGRQLHHCRRSGTSHNLRQLEQAIAAFHRLGIVHNDLRGRENVLLVEPEDRVAIVDWAGAVHLPPGTLRHRLLFPWLVKVDYAGLLKWKEMLEPGSLDAAERTFMSRFWRVRPLWPFNRKTLRGQRYRPS
jgi:predicted Ser/Thr protein kinase